jgi:hypothetical protein
MTDKLTKQTRKRKKRQSPNIRTKKDKIDPDSDSQKIGPTVLIPFVPSQPSSTQESGTLETITRRDVMVTEPTEVQVPERVGGKTLGSLLMQTGPLEGLVKKEDNTWPGIAKELKKVFLPYQKSLKSPQARASYVAELGTVYYGPGKVAMIKEDLENSKWTNQMPEVVKFLEKFMDANGQWGYIEKQDWFKKGDYVIGIDVNYYPDRSGFNPDSPQFHKDTGGNNIFVNLVFDNEKDIEATEWFADPEQPSKKRAAWQEKLLPKSYLDELDRTRTTLREQHDKDSPVNGGVSRGKYTYVSWVDDLVWHSTPTDNPRLKYTADAAKLAYKNLDTALKKGQAGYYDEQQGRTILAVEILGTMAEAEGTELHKWLKVKGLRAQDINLELARQAWAQLYQNTAGQEQYFQDVAKRAETDWRITGKYSEATAEDSRLGGTSSMQETPISLSTRRRANSLPGTQKEIAKVRAANKDEARSFIRTWVRILPKDSAELREAGVI